MQDDIQQALQLEGLLFYFKKLPPSHQSEYVDWINAAKKEETRKRRIKKMIEMVKVKNKV